MVPSILFTIMLDISYENMSFKAANFSSFRVFDLFSYGFKIVICAFMDIVEFYVF